MEPPSEARLTVYGCEGGRGTVELRAGSITGRLLDSVTITVRTPTPTPTPVTPSGELSATKTSIVVGDEVTVSAVNVSPSGQSVYIVTNGRLDFARPGTCHFEIGPRSSEKSTRSWTLEGCSPPGSGSVTLKTRHNGSTVVLDSITIDVRTSPTPTYTPTAEPTATTTTPVVVPTATTTTPVVVPTATTTVVEPPATTTDPVDPCRSQSDSREKCTIPPTYTPTATPRPVTLDTPGNFRSILGPGAGAMTLKWNAVAGATRYEVQQKKVKTAWPDEWKPLPFDSFTVDIRGTQAVVGGLQNDKSYHHRVRGVSADGRSEWTPELTTDLAELLKPRGLVGSVKQSSIGEIALQWSAVSVATRYEVQQKVVRALWFDDWQTLPFQNVSITIAGSQAVIGNLRYGATYEHQVRSVNAAGPSGWSTSVRTDDLSSLPARGHQQDHTVRYLVAPMSATPEPGFPNPATIIQTAVPTAAAEWNARISAHGFLICKEGTGGCDDQTNADEKTVTIRLVPYTGAYTPCGSIACTRPPSKGLHIHLGNEQIFLEEPAWWEGRGGWHRWTDVADLDDEPVEGEEGETWAYVGRALMHEFGHPLGIGHPSSTFPGVMSGTHSRIRQGDIDYLRMIYSGHVRGE